MKDLPGWLWILGIFVVGAISIFIYGKTSPDPLPQALSPWSFVEMSREDIEKRAWDLGEGEGRKERSGAYEIRVERLSNIEEPEVYGRYVIRIRSKAFMPRYLLWNEEGLDVAFMDRRPDASYGELELMSIRKVKKGLSE